MQVDFYILHTQALHARESFVCRLSDKARRQGLGVYICVDNNGQGRYLDQLLWTYADDSFLAHDLHQDLTDEPSPSSILIGSAPESAPHHDTLINLAAQVPPAYQNFARVLELITQEEPVLQEGRRRYAFYLQAGMEAARDEETQRYTAGGVEFEHRRLLSL